MKRDDVDELGGVAWTLCMLSTAFLFLLFVAAISGCAHSRSVTSESHIATAAQSTQVATSTEKAQWQQTAAAELHENSSSQSAKNVHEVVTTETWEPRKSGPPKYTKRVVDKSTADQAATATLSSALSVSTAGGSHIEEQKSKSKEASNSNADAKSTAVTRTSAPWPWKLIAAGVMALCAAVWFGRKWLATTWRRFV